MTEHRRLAAILVADVVGYANNFRFGKSGIEADRERASTAEAALAMLWPRVLGEIKRRGPELPVMMGDRLWRRGSPPRGSRGRCR
jgi:hypothetical protein